MVKKFLNILTNESVFLNMNIDSKYECMLIFLMDKKRLWLRRQYQGNGPVARKLILRWNADGRRGI